MIVDLMFNVRNHFTTMVDWNEIFGKKMLETAQVNWFFWFIFVLDFSLAMALNCPE